MSGHGSDIHETTATPIRAIRGKGKIGTVVQIAIDNGHDIVDLDPNEPVATGVFAKCAACKAYLRYYFNRGSGEAFQTTCRFNMPPVITGESQVQDAEILPEALSPDPTRSEVHAKYRGYTLNDWADEIHKYAIAKGWWDTPASRNFGDLIALLHSEAAEAYEEYRNGKKYNERYYDWDKAVNESDDVMLPKPEGIPSELGDIIIRIFDMCAYYQIDIEDVVIEKHRYNLSRKYRHGGKVS